MLGVALVPLRLSRRLKSRPRHAPIACLNKSQNVGSVHTCSCVLSTHQHCPQRPDVVASSGRQLGPRASPCPPQACCPSGSC